MSKIIKQPAPRTDLLHTNQPTSPDIRDKLGEQLRAMCGRSDEEPRPDWLPHVVRQLDQHRFGGKR